jgi:hypothetical protein
VAAQTLSGEVSQLELQLKYKKAELKQSQEERTKLQVRRPFLPALLQRRTPPLRS